jgi:hypothetical protein
MDLLFAVRGAPLVFLGVSYVAHGCRTVRQCDRSVRHHRGGLWLWFRTLHQGLISMPHQSTQLLVTKL